MYLEILKVHINCKSIVMGTDGHKFPGWFNFHANVPSEAISSDHDERPLCSAVFGLCPMPMGEEGGIILALMLLQLFPRLNEVWWYPFENLSPWLSVGVILAELHEFMCVCSCDIGPVMLRLISPLLSYKLLFS